MSSEQPTSQAGRHLRARRRRGPASWTLRTRLLLTLVGVVIAVCAIIGGTTTVLVYKFQVKQLDIRLGGAANRALTFTTHPPSDFKGARPPLEQAPGNGMPGTLNVRIVDGTIQDA